MNSKACPGIAKENAFTPRNKARIESVLADTAALQEISWLPEEMQLSCSPFLFSRVTCFIVAYRQRATLHYDANIQRSLDYHSSSVVCVYLLLNQLEYSGFKTYK